jgi:SpoVK/Ycf46/Vps4 family AAA+-type ATPase
MERSELREKITYAIRMYDVEGTECLKNIPHSMHESIIYANQQIDKHVKSSESGYDEAQLDSYCESEQIKIVKAYNKSLAPSREKRNEKLRNRYAADLNFKEKIKEKNLEAYHVKTAKILILE